MSLETSQCVNDTVEMAALDLENGQLVHWKYGEVITVHTVKRTLQRLKAIALMFGNAEKRFVDLRNVQHITVPEKQIKKFAEARKRLLSSKTPVKTAVLLPTHVDATVIERYRTLVEDSPIEVEVFHTLTDCAVYLDIKERLLS